MGPPDLTNISLYANSDVQLGERLGSSLCFFSHFPMTELEKLYYLIYLKMSKILHIPKVVPRRPSLEKSPVWPPCTYVCAITLTGRD